MTIARDSTSYPFLAVAQAHGVPYGLVLSYADAVEKLRLMVTSLTVWEERAMVGLSPAVKADVQDALIREFDRQAQVTGPG